MSDNSVEKMAHEYTLAARVKIKLFGSIYIGHFSKPGWNGSLPFFMFKCEKHGIVTNYPMGFEATLRCPHCERERSDQ